MENQTETKCRVLKSQRSDWLLRPNSNGLDYKDPHGGTPDLGIYTCYDGKYVGTWGLKLYENELISGESYVWYYTYPEMEKVKTFERIISKVP